MQTNIRSATPLLFLVALNIPTQQEFPKGGEVKMLDQAAARAYPHNHSYFLLLTSIFLLLTSIFLLLTSYFYLLTSYFLLLTSIFYLPSPISYLLHSVFCILSPKLKGQRQLKHFFTALYMYFYGITFVEFA